MALSRRYSPEFAPGEKSIIAFDFSPIVPPGIGLQSASCSVYTNTVPPILVNEEFTFEGIGVLGRTAYGTISGGIAGRDYQFRWVAIDTEGFVWVRTALLLCADTS